MDYLKQLKYHFRPKNGWINDPNGLVYYGGYYHVFYQHAPHYETPWKEPMHWGHARTRDFLSWEELPVALTPSEPYDADGCWSGTAIVQDDTLYLVYSSVRVKDGVTEQTVSVAYSKDGVNFVKHPSNPVIAHFPKDGGPDFRDPAVYETNGKYYCIMASGNPETRTARLLLYKSQDLLSWKYSGIMSEWANCKYAECPSFMQTADGKFLLTASVCPLDKPHYFSVAYGDFINGKFTATIVAQPDQGPDQYAGQAFRERLMGRNVLIAWTPGWEYAGHAEKDIGCMSIPRELVVENGKIYARPVKEVRHLMKNRDEFVKLTDDGFIIERTGRAPVIHKGEIKELEILRDEYLLEVFVNNGEKVYTVLL